MRIFGTPYESERSCASRIAHESGRGVYGDLMIFCLHPAVDRNRRLRSVSGYIRGDIGGMKRIWLSLSSLQQTRSLPRLVLHGQPRLEAPRPCQKCCHRLCKEEPCQDKALLIRLETTVPREKAGNMIGTGWVSKPLPFSPRAQWG